MPTSREGRAVMIGLIVIGAALAVRFVGVPYGRIVSAARDELAVEQELLQREVALLGAARAFPEDLRVVSEEMLEYAPRLLPLDSTSTAASAVSDYVREVARDIPMTITRTQPVAMEEMSGVRRVALRVEGESDLEGFLSLVAALESGPYLFHLHDLSMHRADAPRSPSRDADAETIRFEFVAVGFGLELPPSSRPRENGIATGRPERRTGAAASTEGIGGSP